MVIPSRRNAAATELLSDLSTAIAGTTGYFRMAILKLEGQLLGSKAWVSAPQVFQAVDQMARWTSDYIGSETP
jgi:hypothetical protein